MFNLFRADLYRMVRMRSFWIFIVTSIALMVAVAGFLSWVASPEFAQMVNDSITEESLAGMSEAERAEALADADEALEDIETLNTKVQESLTYTWANTFLGGGALGLIGSLFAGIFLIMDFKRGFIKNLPLDRKGRMKYFGEKLLFVAFIQLIFLAVCAVFATLSFQMFGFTYEVVDPMPGILLWLLLAFMTCTAYAFIITCITWISRSEVLATTSIIVLSSGMFGAFLGQLLGYLATMAPFFGDVAQWIPVDSLSHLYGGAQVLAQPYGQGIFASMSVGCHVAIVSGIYIIVMAAIAMLVCRKQDIR